MIFLLLNRSCFQQSRNQFPEGSYLLRKNMGKTNRRSSIGIAALQKTPENRNEEDAFLNRKLE